MIHVCSLAKIDATVAATGARHLISVINRDTEVVRPAAIRAEDHLFIGMNDITVPREGLIHPAAEHVDEILGFVRRWPRQAPLVVHCYAGISRSTASAFIAACALAPEADEMEIARRLRAASPSATPNALLVALADAALAREGRMKAAVAAIGIGRFAFEGEPFELTVG